MRSLLLASVSSVALAGTAWAGQAPKPMQPMPVPAPSWAGFYAGLDLGWIENRAAVAELAQGFSDLNTSMTVNGVIGGGHVGYNWQFQQIVLGVETDLGGANGSRSVSYPPGITDPDTFSSSIKWLSTFRGRAGVVFDEWLVYGTAGWAVAGVHNTRTDFSGPFILDQTTTMSGIRLGWWRGIYAEPQLDRAGRSFGRRSRQ